MEFPNDRGEIEYNLKANAMIKLITRLMFVWFMKQKGLVPQGLFDKEKIDELLEYNDKTDSTYYKAILQNLFFATLNTPLGPKRKWVTRSNYGVQNYYRYKRFIKDEARFMEWMNQIPFLNGGLFENLDIIQTEDKENNIPKINIRVDCFSDNPKNESRLKVPDYLFFGTRQADISGFFEDNKKTDVEITGIIDILNRYDFTIDENTPDDQEVALDPELLGTVFENLLASYNPETQSTARKESGSFYTPRPIVDYMVRESLEYYLADAVTIDKNKLHKISNPEAELALSDAEKTKIVSALSEIKILDPACGSGAFPMGCLQHIVQILNRLDPENEKWKAAQVTKLKQDLIDTIDNSDYENLKNKIDQVFSNQYNDADYARKLYLIQNCLYGVDIQPIAMQISKLRFFISLLVEQKIDREEKNFGIIPLPNLETKFVAANTLLKLDKRVSTKKGNVGSGLFQNLFVEEKEEELAKVREKYFSARTPKTKRKWRAKDKALRQQIANLLIDDGWDNAAAHNIAQWDPFNQNTKADWFDPEWMFGVKAFDVVIGNPPYIQLQKALPGSDTRKYADLYKNVGYTTFERTGDIYSLFYEMGIETLQPNGVLSYITSNKWMRAKYGKSLRKYLSNKKPLQLIDLGPGIFEAATVDVNILLAQNRKTKQHKLNALTLLDKKQINRLTESDFVPLVGLSEDSWIILNPLEQQIKEKMEQEGTPLKNWNIKINYGIKTGYNPAFIIDHYLKDQLIEKDPKSAEILKPILRGRDIKRYKAEFADLWLIATVPAKNINIDNYPEIKKFLIGLKPKLNQNGVVLTTNEKKLMTKHGQCYGLRLGFTSKEKSRKKTTNKWFETQDHINYWEGFEGEKIIYPEMTKYLNFVFDTKGSYTNNKNFICYGTDLKYLIAFFNSKAFHWTLKKTFPELQGGTRELRKVFFERLTIPKIRKTDIFDYLINRIILSKNESKDRIKEEDLIDLNVYRLYNLNYDEILIIDPETPITKKEYENFTL